MPVWETDDDGVARVYFGTSESLDGAFEAAYRNARDDRTGTLTFRVVDIEVTGNNPITEYKVGVTPSGN